MLLTRTAQNNARTSERLEQLGFKAVSIALGEMVDIAPPTIRVGQAVIFTSSAAVDVLANRGIGGHSSIEVFCVGERTKQAAQQIGFNKFISVANSAEQLSKMMVEHYSNTLVKVDYFAGRNRSFDFAHAFAGSNIELDITELYKIKRIVPEPHELQNAMNETKNGVQLHFSSLSAAYLFDLVAKYQLQELSKTMDAVTISNKTSLAVDKSLVKSVQNAKIASEAGLIAALQDMQRTQ